jgi:hypothetical protein
MRFKDLKSPVIKAVVLALKFQKTLFLTGQHLDKAGILDVDSYTEVVQEIFYYEDSSNKTMIDYTLELLAVPDDVDLKEACKEIIYGYELLEYDEFETINKICCKIKEYNYNLQQLKED